MNDSECIGIYVTLIELSCKKYNRIYENTISLTNEPLIYGLEWEQYRWPLSNTRRVCPYLT